MKQELKQPHECSFLFFYRMIIAIFSVCLPYIKIIRIKMVATAIRKLIFGTIVAGILITSVSAPLNAQTEALELVNITTREQWDSVMELSGQTGRPVFVGIHASWCGYCKRLHSIVYADSVVAGYFNSNFINISIDVGQAFGKKIASTYGVRGYPTLLFLNGEGKVINRINGYVEPAVFLSYGRRSLRKYKTERGG